MILGSMQKIKVDFIGLGAAKCGTTWITDNLRAHPEIGYPEINELNYFSKTRANNTKSEYSLSGLKGYLQLFKNHVKKVNGEFSTHYLPDSTTAEIIKKHFPNIKLLVALREPVERAYSDYLNNKYLSLTENQDFETAFFNRHKSYYDNYKEKGMYYKQLKPYFNLFPRKNIKIILLEDIKENPKKTIKEIYSFLQVDPNFIPPEIDKRSNISSKTRFIFFRKFMNSLSNTVHFLESKGKTLGKILSFLKRKTKLNKLYWYLVNTLNKEKLEKEKLSPELKKKLQKTYSEDIKKLEKLIKRDLSKWKN